MQFGKDFVAIAWAFWLITISKVYVEYSLDGNYLGSNGSTLYYREQDDTPLTVQYADVK